MARKNKYDQTIEKVFFSHYKKGRKKFSFSRKEIEKSGVKNVGDIIYTYRYRGQLPPRILETAPQSLEWLIRPEGIGKYRFELQKEFNITPNTNIAETKILDASPGFIVKYALNDEQALLAKVRYNRLIDVFTGLTCYSLQNHLRTTVKGIGQVETDEIYVGVDRRGAHYVIPVQAKGGNDKIGRIQIEQDIALCKEKFSKLIPKPVAAQFIDPHLIALFEFVEQRGQLKIAVEKHYRLVSPDDLSDDELEQYKESSFG